MKKHNVPQQYVERYIGYTFHMAHNFVIKNCGVTFVLVPDLLENLKNAKQRIL
jgi:hypothetical protein